MSRQRIVIVHDYLTQRGGAERVVLAMLRAFPDATLITSIYSPQATYPEFSAYRISTLWLDRLPLVRRDARLALPFLAQAFSSRQVRDADVVLCSSSGWAHGIRSRAPKVVYCHNPPRWLYQRDEYLVGQPRLARGMLTAMRPYLRSWDQRAAATADRYLANSSSVQRRIEAAYGIEADILHPPVAVDVDGVQEPLSGVEPGSYWLTVSRPRGYKNARAVCEAVEGFTDDNLLVIGSLPQPPQGGRWSTRITAVSGISDAQLRWAYANCRGLVAASYEDFGLTPIEANAFGKPVAALRAGGYLDTIRDGVNGVFFQHLEVRKIAAALDDLRRSPLDPSRIIEHAAGFAEQQFARRLQEIVDDAARARTPDASGRQVPGTSRYRKL